MAQSNQQSAEGNHYERALDSLHQSIQALDSHSQQHLLKRYGLSQDFRLALKTEAEAMALCERAMEALAGDYVDHLVDFKDQHDPIQCMHHLEEAEALWAAESTLIMHLDAGGEEKAFLLEMREKALTVLEERLRAAAEICHKNASPENVALCIAIMGTMDRMYADLGHPEGSEERRKLRDVARGFRI